MTNTFKGIVLGALVMLIVSDTRLVILEVSNVDVTTQLASGSYRRQQSLRP